MSLDAVKSNPFALMTSPEVIFAAIERSERLARLTSTICRPLDKPRPEKPVTELRAFDEEIESIEIVEPEPVAEPEPVSTASEDESDPGEPEMLDRIIETAPMTDWDALTSLGD